MADTEAATTETEDQTTESQVEETENTESQTDETAAAETTEESADESESDESEASEDAAESDDTEDNQTEEKPQKKTKQDYIEARIARREAKREALEALHEAQNEFRANMDESDWEQRVQAIENERFIERVDTNISNATRDIADAQELPVFKENPAIFADLMYEALDRYGVFHDEMTNKKTGDPVFLGFYDPKTGQPISIKNIALREANRLDHIAERVRTSAKVEAAKGEAKMRASAEAPYTGSESSVDTTGDENLTAEQYAKKHNLVTVRS